MKFLAAILFMASPLAISATGKGSTGGGGTTGGSGNGPMETCSDQSKCFDITMEKVDNGSTCGGPCEYLICMEFNKDHGDGSCPKQSGTISHTCEKSQSCNGGQVGFAGTPTNEGLSNGYKYCQTVPSEGVAEFLFKDGNADSGCGSATVQFIGDYVANCQTNQGGSGNVNSCTGAGNLGKECLWTIQAPKGCVNVGGSGGDPHIRLWNGTRYSFHGECDLVMIKNEDYAEGQGLDLHMRTTIKDFYSFIESAALRIGEDIIEVTMGHMWVNGEEKFDEDLPLKIGENTLHPPTTVKNSKIYMMDLGNGDHVNFRLYKFFMAVDVGGTQANFERSSGLLGDYHTGDMYGRDGQTVFVTENDFGMEWQVQADEPKLFRENRSPQLPHAKCNMPVATERHLRARADRALLVAAEDACAHKSANDFEFCVTDVLATGDLGMAHAW